MFAGSAVALITPFKDGEVDFERYEALIEEQIAAGTDVLVPTGTTGESPTLSHAEHRDVVSRCVEVAKGRVKVLAGSGSNSTREAVGLARHAREMGADGALLVSPYYNKPTQEGLYHHYRKIAEEAGIPIVLYSVPGRTGREIGVETVARLSEVPNIVAIKEAGGSVDRVSAIKARCDIQVISGDDNLTLPMMAVGADGVISVIANLIPGDVKKMVSLAAENRFPEAREIHLKMWPLVAELFRENSPMGVKTAMKLVGKYNGEVRPPLSDYPEASTELMRKALQDYGLL